MAGRPRSEQGDAYRNRILGFVQEYRREHGFPPKLADMCEVLGITRTGVRHHLAMLRGDDFVTYTDAEIARTLAVTPKGAAHLRKVAKEANGHREHPVAVNTRGTSAASRKH